PLRALSRRNALELSDSRWRYDVQRLMSALERLLADTSAVQPRPYATADTPRPRRMQAASLALGVTIGAALTGLASRAFADRLRWGPHTDGGRVLQPVLLQGLTWAVVGAVVAVPLAVWVGGRRGWLGAFAMGALTGAVAGAVGAAINNIPRFLVNPSPSDSNLEAISVIVLGVTVALGC